MEQAQQKIKACLMFDGRAEQAMNDYLSVFDQAEILSIHRYGANEAGAEGAVAHATFSLYGQVFMCMALSVAAPARHPCSTPATPLVALADHRAHPA